MRNVIVNAAAGFGLVAIVAATASSAAAPRLTVVVPN
jgi:hypothetical protein